MNAQELAGVQLQFEIGDGLIDTVLAAVDGGIGEFVAGHKVRHGVEVKEGDAFSHARGDAARVIGPLAAERCGQFLEQGGQIGVPLPVWLDDGPGAGRVS